LFVLIYREYANRTAKFITNYVEKISHALRMSYVAIKKVCVLLIKRNAFFWNVTPRGSCKNRRFISLTRIDELGRTLAVTSNGVVYEEILCEKGSIRIGYRNEGSGEVRSSRKLPWVLGEI
jgi:hypothetical protein